MRAAIPAVLMSVSCMLLSALGCAQQGNDMTTGQPTHPCVLVNARTLEGLRDKAFDATPNKFGFETKSAWEKIKAAADRFLQADAYSYSVNIPLAGNKTAGLWEYTLSDQTPPRHDDTPNYPPWTAMFQERADSITTRLMHLSFAYLVTGETQYAARARKIALHLSEWDQWTDPSYGGGNIQACLDTGHCTYAMGMFYDWCFDTMDASERSQVRQAIIDKGINACLAGVDRYPPDTNGYAVILCGAALGAIAVRAEEPAADDWLAACTRKIRVSLDRGGEDGGAFEGPGYGTYLLDSFAKAFDGLEAAGIKHDLFEHPYLATMDRYCIGLLAPDTKQMPCFSDGSPTAGYPQIMSVLAHRGSTDAAWYLQQTGALSVSGIYDLIRFDEDKLNPVEPAWNPSTVFVDIGCASLRDGFNAQAPTLFLKSGPYANNIGHNHYDHNAFVISYGGQWVIPDRGYHSRYDPNERKFSLGSMGHCTVVLDADEDYFASTQVPNPGHDQVKRTGGRIAQYFGADQFDYVKGQAAEAYNTDEQMVLTRFDRSIVFIKPHFFVVHDELAAPQAHSFNFLLHSDGLGTIETQGDVFTVSRTTGQVYGQVLSSAQVTPHVEMYPGAERYGPYLRVETEPTDTATFTALLYPRPNVNPRFLRNGGFESGMAGWRPRANEDLPNHTIVEEGAVEGAKCACIETSGYYYSDQFSLPVGATMTVRAMVRTTDLPEGKGANLRVHFWKSGKAFANKSIGPFAHADWREHSMTTTVPEGTESVSLALEFFAPGTAWFDDARIEADVQVKQPSTPTIAPLGTDAMRVELDGWQYLVSFGQSAQVRTDGRLRTDAEAAVIAIGPEGEPTRVFIHGGTFVDLDGVELLKLGEAGTADMSVIDGVLTGQLTYDPTPHAALPDDFSLDTCWAVERAVVNGQAAQVQQTAGGCRVRSG